MVSIVPAYMQGRVEAWLKSGREVMLWGFWGHSLATFDADRPWTSPRRSAAAKESVLNRYYLIFINIES